jgi:hypothetical protein
MKYHPDRKPRGAQNADRGVRPTDAEAKESKNVSSVSKIAFHCSSRNF